MGQQLEKTYTAPDGSVYRVNEDGSVTKIIDGAGNVPPKKRSWIWIVILIVVGLGLGITGVVLIMDSLENEHDYYTSQQYYMGDNPIEDPGQGMYEQTAEVPAEEQTAVEYDYAFISNGLFYGTIGGYPVHGSLNLETESPDGWLYYDTDSSSGDAMYLSGYYDGSSWSEYYGDQYTGEFSFDVWDISRDNFARGTYTRSSDGQQFYVELYKSPDNY